MPHDIAHGAPSQYIGRRLFFGRFEATLVKQVCRDIAFDFGLSPTAVEARRPAIRIMVSVFMI